MQLLDELADRFLTYDGLIDDPVNPARKELKQSIHSLNAGRRSMSDEV